MNKSIKKILKTGIVFLLVCIMVMPSLASSTEIKDAENKIDDMEQNKKDLEKTIADLAKLKGNTEVYVKELDIKLNEIFTRLAELELQMTQKQAEITITQEELEVARIVEENQYNSMKLRIQYMYEKGDTNYVDLLLASSSATELLSRAEYISQISEYDRDMLVRYQETKDLIAENEVRLEAEYVALEGIQSETQQKQASVEALITEKNIELAQYEADIVVAQEQVDKYQRDIKSQEDKIKKIEAEIKKREEAAAASRAAAEAAAAAAGKENNGGSSVSNASLIWPCPSSKRVTSEFGSRESPVAGASSYHQGMDIGASTGTQIIAAAAGEVVISSYSYSAGNYIMISHGNGLSTVYMHCSKLLVSEGTYVNQGDVIALVGSTGYSTGPHLHFGVRVNGSYTNPRGYVK